jgi:tetrapyrrole methylase family protein/MazG family protein
MRVVHLEPGPLDEKLAERLRSSRVYLAQPEPHAVSALKEANVPWLALQDEIEPDSILVLPLRPLDELARVSDRLLGPGGCPWDQAQTHESLKKYLLEEAYEVLDAIDTGSMPKLREELGDLLLQPVMHAQMRKLAGDFDIDDVAREIVEKLIRRHPHVFGDVSVADADEVLKNWDRIKRTEKGDAPASVLAGVPVGMASLLRAHEVSKRAARVGFEWPHIEAVFAKLYEEEAELREAVSSGDPDRVEAEIGDLLFTAVNIARWLGVEPEEALRKMLNRFSARFRCMEQSAAKDLHDLGADEWDALWIEAKRAHG